MAQTGNILVILPNWIGDVVMATPVLRALRLARPEARITYVARPGALALLAGCAWCDATISDRSNDRPRLGHWLRLLGAIRRSDADVAILLPNSFRSAISAWLGRAGRRIGYDRDARGRLLTDRLAPPRDDTGRFRPTPMIDYYAKLLRPLGIPLPSRAMELPLAPDDDARAQALLRDAGVDADRPVVLLNPSAAFGASKLWPADRYAALADALIETRRAQILINAAPNDAERALADQVAGHMRHEPKFNLARRDNTLGLLKGLLRRCDLLVTNDTGARHVAAAMGTAVVTIFGSTDPDWTRIDYARERIVRANVPCGPCQRKTCPLPSGAGVLRCLTEISVETVLAAAEELLAAPAKEAL